MGRSRGTTGERKSGQGLLNSQGTRLNVDFFGGIVGVYDGGGRSMWQSRLPSPDADFVVLRGGGPRQYLRYLRALLSLANYPIVVSIVLRSCGALGSSTCEGSGAQ